MEMIQRGQALAFPLPIIREDSEQFPFYLKQQAQSDEGSSWIKGSTTDPILISTMIILLPPAGLI